MINRKHLLIAVLWIFCLLAIPASGSAGQLKGLLVYDSIYSSTVEVAYWIKAIIGYDQHLDVKKIDQVITVKPYDYVIIGSYTKWEKPSPRISKFVEVFQDDLATKKVAYFLTCGDFDETMILPVAIISGKYRKNIPTLNRSLSPDSAGARFSRRCRALIHS